MSNLDDGFLEKVAKKIAANFDEEDLSTEITNAMVRVAGIKEAGRLYEMAAKCLSLEEAKNLRDAADEILDRFE